MPRRIIGGAFVVTACAVAVAMACSPRVQGPSNVPVQRGEVTGRLDGLDRTALIALAGNAKNAPVSATGAWHIDEQGGHAALVRGAGGEPWRIERSGMLLRVAGEGDDHTPWRRGPFVLRPGAVDSYLMFEGRPYRGELWISATDTGLLVVNRVLVEQYLRGVVPLELGTRNESDLAALEAQAIAARSYAYQRVPSGELHIPPRGWHMVATVSNQVYRGMEAEHPVVDAAIASTAGLVLRYRGLMVDAPYFSSCGGRTASPREVWREARAEPYLESVSDTNPATGRPWCDVSPRHQWAAEFDEAELTEVARRALETVGRRSARPELQELTVTSRSPSGRVGELLVRTNSGDVRLRLDGIRTVFRNARGAILNSTYFSVDRVASEHGHLSSLTLRGTGNGHGVGMCQWGAIARARAGHDSRAILRHYYPGTVVGFAD